MDFYKEDNLAFSIIINEDYFKYKGKTYKFNENE